MTAAQKKQAEWIVKDEAKVRAAGILFTDPLNNGLFLRRSAQGDHAGEWCLPGGVINEGEDAEHAARRETVEETGMLPQWGLTLLNRATSDEGVDFSTYGQSVQDKFEPRLNDEHTEFQWALLNKPPEPLHSGVSQFLQASRGYKPQAQDSFAMDRDTVRTKGADGHLHVAVTPISKAAVNEYYGKEIPNAEELGLDPNKSYRLLRDPVELAKAAPTFNNLPLLSEHRPVSADAHPDELVIGATGTDCSFDAPYLKNSLAVWKGDAIRMIEADLQKQLSSAYRYRADMTPGTFEGQPYDGVMRDIVGNHVALVREGRAGADVVVGDSKRKEWHMPQTIKLSRYGSCVLGALLGYMAPKLAQDAKINWNPVLEGITKNNFKDKRKGMVDEIVKQTKGKLAQDASVDDLCQLMDVLEAHEPLEGGTTDAEVTDPNSATPASPNNGSENDNLRSYLKSKGLDDAAIEEALRLIATGAMDADKDDEDKKKKAAEEEEKKKKAEDEKEKVTKPAMDEAIAKAVKNATETATKVQRDIRDAERAVRPYVGELSMAFDSAADVYQAAFKTLGVDTKGVPPEAFPAMLKLVQKPGEKKHESRLAQDASTHKSFAERFPEAARVGTL